MFCVHQVLLHNHLGKCLSHLLVQMVGGGDARGRAGRGAGTGAGTDAGAASSIPARDLSELSELPVEDAQRWRGVIL